jgi:protein transport protein SEC61 subunit gamma-like protein
MEEVNVQQKQEQHKEEKQKGPGIFSRLKNKLTGYKRVVDVARKPTREEFSSSMKITGSGIILIGAIGFVIFLAYFILTKLVI